MRTIRGFFSGISSSLDNIQITGEYYNYFKNVLRLKKDDFIELFNNHDSKQYKTKIIVINNKHIELEVVSSQLIDNENPYTINLYQSIIKNENFDLVVQKATELGVNNIFPLITERTNHKFDKKNFDKKLERWTKIAINASEQCARVFIPEIHSLTQLDSINLMSEAVNITLCPYTKTDPSFISKIKNNSNFNIFIGPEGGFSDTEISFFKENNFFMVNLGKRILKAETTPVNILSILNFIKQTY
ncbi:16S rRNA (uracil(1498)-N(3))-methyltransferase [Allofrancisella guangzhouensis]|uniref:Ribosomal RNA small subunit methyltransferase E n=1 Tax=Allofrancisella guangzhouensis TaxID=594679 RepID=A0A0A8E4G4_9GAMM|nr:16S rRNA (uracil(1498)-N(3))-methyltransferase [Allofrancisella guangzhouensis]AJC48864.1 16S rRNA methyltransferase [Allofrancisella guangzhouensis]MBK2027232.1 16S rRNA (uracil(1498)-N(3))-methyltransferase [Allofrancisella guangzhouensis]MBK2043628.1 16S rRNA (uracil(1498)-N(3))-methyltransferase [Allofrancisella guangzhouensis]MBK2045972.1 16S rRNA (uracil(1498)-N(3))-methyltransferase [Allofrancisella guangzhouensis]